MVNPDSEFVNRRGFVGRIVAAILGAVAATLGTVLGGAVVSPGLSARRETWVEAGAVDALVGTRPTEVSLGLEREDGYRTSRERRVVYLVRDGDGVRALSAVCTHLGCRVAWHDAEHEFRCPCHGGRFKADGQVAGGPPPRPLQELPTRIDSARVFVQIA